MDLVVCCVINYPQCHVMIASRERSRTAFPLFTLRVCFSLRTSLNTALSSTVSSLSQNTHTVYKTELLGNEWKYRRSDFMMSFCVGFVFCITTFDVRFLSHPLCCLWSSLLDTSRSRLCGASIRIGFESSPTRPVSGIPHPASQLRHTRNR